MAAVAAGADSQCCNLAVPLPRGVAGAAAKAASVPFGVGAAGDRLGVAAGLPLLGVSAEAPLGVAAFASPLVLGVA
jgi:hypothetical protein